jgi:hypothetical protein
MGGHCPIDAWITEVVAAHRELRDFEAVRPVV